ncbi:nectin-2 isoform X2 [Varanus komodoensis]|uniref:Nectin cell adhesion molecule 3 n=1 Tax=Varanus komodoensis TaxID=61221 RepID=A0A8D2Q3D7_VARKO|nr:nectin-2 isoform X2 [Varanus komodoensis]
MGAPRGSCALASLLCCLLSVAHAQRVNVRNEVTGYLGKEVILPCNFVANSPETKVSQVTWVKETGGRKQNVAVFHPDHGPSYPMERDSTRIRFRTPSLEDATLIIDPLLMSDKGTYTCEFATYPLGNEDGFTELIIVAKPVNRATAEEVKASKIEVPVALCTSSNGKPPARITWQSGLAGNASVSQVVNADSTVTVTSRYSMVPSKEANGQRIACVVEQKTLAQPEVLPVVLSILYPPEVTIQGYDDNWYLSRNEASLTCLAKGNPTPTQFTWTTPSGTLPKSVEVQGARLIVHNVDQSVNTTFICEATNRVGQVRSEQIVFVRDQPAKRQSGSAGALIGSIVGGILALAILGAIVIVFIICRRHSRGAKGSYDPKTRVFGNGTAPPPPGDFTELDRPLKAAPGRGQEDHECDEEEEQEERHSPFGYPSRHLEDERERFDQLGPMLPIGSATRDYEYDDMESQHDGSIISKTAVYV